MKKNGLAFFLVVAIITNLSTVFRAQKYIFFEIVVIRYIKVLRLFIIEGFLC